MAEKVVYLHGEPQPIGHYIRVGTSGHRQLETLLGAGKAKVDRAVVEAAAVERQSDLMAALVEAGTELILDTNVAELACEGRHAGAARSAPWANPESVLTEEDLQPGSNRDVIGQIARFAVEKGFDAVQAPAHLLESSADPMFALDCESALALRTALDAAGGEHIGVDYPLMIKYASLRDPIQRRSFIATLQNVPVENLWMRVSGFGADASGIGTRRYIASVADFQRLGRPIVADGVGGLVGLGIVAFGAASGIAHGVVEKERFDASDWHKPQRSGGGGREKRILVGGLDKLLSIKQVDALMAAQGARRLLSCHDPSCCPHGLEDTLRDPKGHFLRQRARHIQGLAKVPESRRAAHYLEQQLGLVERSARTAVRLKVSDESLTKVLERNSLRLDKMHEVLSALSKEMGEVARSPAPIRRGQKKHGAAREKR